MALLTASVKALLALTIPTRSTKQCERTRKDIVVIAFMQTIPEEGKSQKPLSYLSYEFLSFFLFNQKYTWLYLKSFVPWESDENGLIGRWA